MAMLSKITSPRLLLRTWQQHDLEPLVRMNADPRVMEFFPKMLSPAESYDMFTRFAAHFEKHGFGIYAVEVPGVTPFAGWVGITVPTFEAPFMPCVEIGWRFMAEHWRHGYATEGAKAVLDAGFTQLGFKEIVSFTSPLNVRSVMVMERIGMSHNPADDFNHPRVAADHPLSRHVLYRMKKPTQA